MNWSSSIFGSSDLATSNGSAGSVPSGYGSAKLAATSYGSATTVPTDYASTMLVATCFGSIELVTSSYGSVELVELPGRKGKSFLVIIAGVVAGLALLVPGGILLYGAFAGAAAATGGILSAATALAASYPYVTVVGAGALTGAGFSALMYSIPGGDDWEELGKQILVGAVVGGVTGGVAVGAAFAVKAGYTIAARTVQGVINFGISEVTLQAVIDASIVATAGGVGSAVATHLTTWTIDGELNISQLFVDIGLNTILSIAPVVGGGIAVHFCTSKAAALIAASAGGIAASFLDPPETEGMAVLRAAMGGMQGAVLGVHLHKVASLFHVTKATTVQYLPANKNMENHGFNIYETKVHGHVRTNHKLRTASPGNVSVGREIHLKTPPKSYYPAELARRQANVIQARDEFIRAADHIRNGIQSDGQVYGPNGAVEANNLPPLNKAHQPALQKDGVVHPLLQQQLNAVHRACANGASKVMAEELERALPFIGQRRHQRDRKQ